jgi:Na+-translocating ferredoxin:NAD+ oxidoreductase RnfG subunit
MKQATNPFAPVPLWRKRLPGYAAMGAATVAMAVGLIAMQHARTTVAGTLLPVSEADAAAYGISAVYQLDNGSYRVEGSQKGFQSDVQAAVTLDAEGNVSAVEILSQAETDSLGGQCVDPEFTSQYQGAAPFTLAGKSYTVTDPLTGAAYAAAGAAYAAAGAAEEQPSAAEDFDPAQWNVSDTSPEAEATRRMYAAGLTLSALNGEPLADELAPPLDSSAEAVARRKLYAAGLSKSARDGEEQALPYADWSAEKQAAYRLAQAELTTGQTSAGAVSADLTEVDALSGATITSTAVTNIVNNSYFYVTEVLRAE